ncbi:trypsin-like peptidase domain-containing protein [Ovoidimarina sediminis]|uniref:trypsin-like peptidase domain-containing protein n=1 Tax=Ovoidimarina sediminis TaxID=3079856 RepID=UPI00290E4A50|nr:trypsin-like peptidase domain-containing protein [Rhodophyticola sp. MJ-SS7]MDU8943866.1 trypsin-like peptidase domain-containing protein [Rhodophyticola sp. MJ-SS7]
MKRYPMSSHALSRVSAALVLLFFAGLATPVLAQGTAWVQIEARPNQPSAEDRARAYAAEIADVVGYRLRSGWYAIALGPYTPEAAAAELRRLRALRAIPGDSFISDGQTYGEQFWPPGGAAALAPVLPADPAAPGATPDAAAEPEPADETPAEARAGERRLTRTEREELQRALQIKGFYTAAIDGAFGPGTRRAMANWQSAFGHEPTGILTTAQRRELTEELRAMMASLGFVRVEDSAAGISVDLPLAMVEFDGYEAPFAKYAGTEGAQILLISQSGDQATLAGLFEILQTLEIMPLDGPRDLRRNGFTIEGVNRDISSFAFATLADGAVKGMIIVWPRGDNLRRSIAINRMRESFDTIEGQVLPDTARGEAIERPDLLAGLQIRQPEASLSGFFVTSDGAVLTAASPLEACARITLGDDTEAAITATDAALDLALLRPAARLAPLAIGRLSADLPRLQAEIAVAGYSYGGLLGAPTMSFGTLEDLRGLNGEATLQRLALTVQPGDAGGPVLDADGGVVGILLPRRAENGRSLPDEVQFATKSDQIANFLDANGIAIPVAEEARALAPEDLALIGADMTVLVECWN